MVEIKKSNDTGCNSCGKRDVDICEIYIMHRNQGTCLHLCKDCMLELRNVINQTITEHGEFFKEKTPEEKVIDILKRNLGKYFYSSDLRIVITNKQGACWVYMGIPNREKIDTDISLRMGARIINTKNYLNYTDESNFYGLKIPEANAEKLYKLLHKEKTSSAFYDRR